MILKIHAAQQSVHRTAGGLRILSLIQERNLVPFRWLALPAAGTDYCTCQVRRENFCDAVESILKRNLPLETLH